MFVDTHCHIQSAGLTVGERSTRELWAKAPELTGDELVAAAVEAGISHMVCVGCDLADSRVAIEFVKSRENCVASIGIHPHESQNYAGKPDLLQQFASLLGTEPNLLQLSTRQGDGEERTEPYIKYGDGALEPATQSGAKSSSSAAGLAGRQASAVRKIVAIGECGLDYYYEHSPKAAQIELLEFQLRLAAQHDLPLIFHVRAAFDDFWPIFDKCPGTRGVLHSFTDDATNLAKAVERGLYIGVNGIATFAKDPRQLEVYKTIPLTNLLLETDAPFLTPVPFRGTICQPKHVVVIAEFLSQLRGESTDNLGKSTTQNALNLFKL